MEFNFGLSEFDLRLGDCIAGMARASGAARSISSSRRRPTISGFVTGNLPTIRTANPISTGARNGPRKSVGCFGLTDLFSQHRRGALESDAAARADPPAAQVFRPAKHDPLDQVDLRFRMITVDEISRGHFKPINSPRFLNDCHEYVFHLTPNGNDAARPACPRGALSGQKQYCALGPHRRARPALSREYLVRPLRDDSAPSARSGRTRRLSRCSWRRIASSSMA